MRPDPIVVQKQPASAVVRAGQIVDIEGTLVVQVGGVTQTALWPQGVLYADGDPVRVVYAGAAVGQSEAIVLPPVQASPATSTTRPSEGVVAAVPASSPTITVTVGGSAVTCKFVGSAPTVGARVLIEWRPEFPYVIGVVGTTAAPEPPKPKPKPTPPPAKPTTGSNAYAAGDSAAYAVGSGWNDGYWDSDVVQGTWYGRTSTGSWFYGTGPKALAGRTITRVRMYLPARRRSGLYNNTLTVDLYRHNSTRRPSGDVGRFGAKHSISLPPSWSGGWVTLPTSWGSDIANGGGISISGSDYLVLAGIDRTAASGQLKLDWEK